MKLIISALVALLAGVLLGAIPFVNQYLHWNLYIIIPISGVILGAAFGWLEFMVAKLLHARIGVVGGLFLTLVGAVAYVATDVGIWATTSVEVQGGQSVALRDAVSLPEFMGERLTHSSISRRGKSVEVGKTMTIISFVVDLLGACAGAGLLVFALSSDAPYCERCSRYRKGGATVEREYPLDEAQAENYWRWFDQLKQAQRYAELAAGIQAMPGLNVASRRKIAASESSCPKCGQAAMALSVLHPDKEGDWTTESGRSMEVLAAANEGPRLIA
ncbi:MAG: hypothetical protein QM756_36675 [Polyangiaceae bacterium]